MDYLRHDAFSRREIAELTRVKRPAVSNWERRHDDFPEPVRSGDTELFPVDAILVWLDQRTIPANAREPEEAAGVTYGDRMREALVAESRPAGGGTEAAEDREAKRRPRQIEMVSTQLVRLADHYRNDLSLTDYLELVLALIHLRGTQPDAWTMLTRSSDVQARTRSTAYAATDAPQRWRGGPLHLDRVLDLVRSIDLRDVLDLVDQLPFPLPGADDDLALAVAADVFDVLLPQYRKSGKHGEQFTPASIGRVMARMLQQNEQVDRIYDPFCRTGEILLCAAETMADPAMTAFHGSFPDPRLRSIAVMNLALHGVTPDLSPGPVVPSADDLREATLRRSVDLVLSNPPFNRSTAGGQDELFADPSAWPFGPPPPHSGNFAWLQYAVELLNDRGRAAVVMTNSATFSSRGGERRIREAMVDAGVVECLVALPSQLFAQTSIPVSLWILRRPRSEPGPVLFVDASQLGTMTSRAGRTLADTDIDTIANAYGDWRSTREAGDPYDGIEGLSRVVPLAEIRAAEYSLSPPAYVQPRRTAMSAAERAAEFTKLAARLGRLHAEAADVDARVDSLLEGIDTWKR
jgi:type I restriction enzyme M protein